MATEKQIEANRRNAQKSTGPRTEEGRAKVALNGITHGLTAKILVLPGENPSEFDALLAELQAEHLPATPSEEVIVRQMALAAWRLRRVHHVESAVYQIRLCDLEENFEDNYDPKPNEWEQLAKVYLDDSGDSRGFDNLSRYEARLERSFYKALTQLRRLREQRQSEMKNQTQFAPAPDPEPAADPIPSPPLPKPAPLSPDTDQPAPLQCAQRHDRHKMPPKLGFDWKRKEKRSWRSGAAAWAPPHRKAIS